MRRTLFVRLMLAFLLVVLVSTTARSVPLVISYRGVATRQLQRNLLPNAESAARYVAEDLAEGARVSLDDMPFRERLSGLRIWIMSQDRRIVFDTGSNPSWVGSQLRPAETFGVLEGTSALKRGQSPWLTSDVMSATVPVYHGGAIVGGVFLFSPLAQAGREESEVTAGIISTAFLALFCGLLAALLLSRSLASPLVRLTNFARRLGQGEFGGSVQVSGGVEELQSLAQTLSHTSVRLRELFEALNAEKQRVQSIIQSMTEGVIATDERGGVVFVNEAATRMLHLPEAPPAIAPKGSAREGGGACGRTWWQTSRTNCARPWPPSPPSWRRSTTAWSSRKTSRATCRRSWASWRACGA